LSGVKKIHNGACCVAATLVLLCGAAAGRQPGHELAAGDVARQPAGAGQQVIETGPPRAEVAVRAFGLVEGWVRAGAMSAAAAEPNRADGPPPSFPGVLLTLRLDGQVLGRGLDLSGGGDSLWLATSSAVQEAQARMPAARDAVAEQEQRKSFERMDLSLELAGALVPFSPMTFGDVDALVQPGLEGVAVRLGEKLVGIFPSSMLIAGMLPSDGLASVISEAAGDATLAIKASPKGQPGQIEKDRGATFYKFAVTHLAQLQGKRRPVFLWRGGMVVKPQDLSSGALHRFADMLAGNLVNRMSHGEGTSGMGGTYLPLQGRYETESASTVEELVAVVALARYCVVGGGASTLEKSIEGGWQLLGHSEAAAGEGAVEAAAWIVAEHELEIASKRLDAAPGAGTVRDVDAGVRERLGALVSAAYAPEGGWLPQVPEFGRSLVALALVIRSLEPGLEEAQRAERRSHAESAVRSLYRDTPAARLVSHMPWLAEAELALAEGEAVVPAAVALRDMRDLVWKHQLTPEDAGSEAPDLVGGIVFTAAANPLPTWQTVRPVLALAVLARDARVTDAKERFREGSRLLAAVRFLRQLCVDEYSGYGAPALETALGGVRSSLWDQRQPVEATALTLVTVLEVLGALEAMAEGPQEPPRPPGREVPKSTEK